MYRLLLTASVVALLAGCDSGIAHVKGRIVENGQPLTFGMNQAAVELTPLGADGQPDVAKTFTAVVNADGSFEVVASAGKLPTGQYQIAFRGYGAMASKGKGIPPFKREIKSGTNELVLDLAKPE